jgi:DNA-binding phage protein
MGFTRPVKETILKRAQWSRAARAALIDEALELIAENDVQTAKSLLRDYIVPAIGWEVVAKQLGKKPASIKRMLSAENNPSINSVTALLTSLKQQDGSQLPEQATR